MNADSQGEEKSSVLVESVGDGRDEQDGNEIALHVVSFWLCIFCVRLTIQMGANNNERVIPENFGLMPEMMTVP